MSAVAGEEHMKYTYNKIKYFIQIKKGVSLLPFFIFFRPIDGFSHHGKSPIASHF